jgi:hypothetical protein
MNLEAQIAALTAMTTAELDAEYQRLHGRPPRYRSVPWLRKRIAFALQTAAFGGLPRVAREALDALCADIVLPASPTTAPTMTDAKPNAPRPGRVLEREWRGQRVRVLVADDGIFEWNGQRFGSLSAVANAVTGAKWNGRLFFNMVERKRT